MRPPADRRRARRLVLALCAWIGACGAIEEARGELDGSVAAGDAELSAADGEAADAEPGAPYRPPQLSIAQLEAAGERKLSELGLYVDLGAKTLAPDLIAYTPSYPLWSDGADKQRWLRLPEGARIDSSDMDAWQVPVGTVLFKEFTRAGKRLETRVLFRFGPAPEQTWMGAFAWQEDEVDAVLVRDGVRDARGSDHDVPSQKSCFTCHNGEPGRVLGVSALQLPALDARLLTRAPDEPYRIPGDDLTRAAIGYLHANCGACHNPSGSARPDTDMNLRWSVTATELASSAFGRSTLGAPLQYFADTTLRMRVVPGAPDESGLLYRMTQRGPRTQMPPFASEHVDPEGVALVRAWIASLPR